MQFANSACYFLKTQKTTNWNVFVCVYNFFNSAVIAFIVCRHLHFYQAIIIAIKAFTFQ